MASNNPKNFLPTKASTSQEWITFYKMLKDRYGATTASGVFAMAWRERKGERADVVTVRNGTGLALDNEGFMDGLRQFSSDKIGILDSIGTIGRYGLYAVAGLSFIFLAGVAYRVVTASAAEVGEATGTAAKVFMPVPKI